MDMVKQIPKKKTQLDNIKILQIDVSIAYSCAKIYNKK